MEKYLTAAQVAAKWGLTVRQVQNMCSSGKIDDVVRENRRWMIPVDAVRPDDHRITNGKYIGWRKRKNEEKRQRMLGLETN